MFCPKCGKELPNDTKFCAFCGASIEQPNGKLTQQKNSPQNKKPKWLWIVLAICAFLILAGASCWYLWQDNAANKNEVSWEELQQAMAASLSVVEKYQDENGCIAPENAEDAIIAVYEAVKDTEGIVSCQKDEYGVYVDVETGLDFVYTPQIADTDTGTGQPEIITLQPYYSVNKLQNPYYDHDGLDECASKLAATDSNWSFQSDKNNLDDSAVTLERILSLDDYKMILWHGHGGYNSYNGYFIDTGIELPSSRWAEYPCLNEENAVATFKGSLCLKPEFFRDNFSDNAFDGAFIYLGTCYSGKETVMADTFIEKGAAVVFVNSESILRQYNLNMIHFISEAFCLQSYSEFIQEKLAEVNASVNSPENWTITEVLSMAQQIYGKQDKHKGAEVFFRCKAGLEQMTYDIWMNLLLSQEEQAYLNEEETTAIEGRKIAKTVVTQGDRRMVTTYEYDKNGFLVKSIMNSNIMQNGVYVSDIQTYSYNDDGMLVASIWDGTVPTGTPNYEYSYEYDNSGRVVSETIWEDSYSEFTYEYGENSIHAYGQGSYQNTDYYPIEYYYEFDEEGRLIYKTYTYSDGFPSEYTYEYPDGASYAIAYDETGFEGCYIVIAMDSFINNVASIDIPQDASVTYDEYGYPVLFETNLESLEITYTS